MEKNINQTKEFFDTSLISVGDKVRITLKSTSNNALFFKNYTTEGIIGHHCLRGKENGGVEVRLSLLYTEKEGEDDELLFSADEIEKIELLKEAPESFIDYIKEQNSGMINDDILALLKLYY